MRLLTVSLAAAAAYAYLASLELADLRADVEIMKIARRRLERTAATLHRRVSRLEDSARIERELERGRDRLMAAVAAEKAEAAQKEPPRYTYAGLLKLAGLEDAK